MFCMKQPHVYLNIVAVDFDRGWTLADTLVLVGHSYQPFAVMGNGSEYIFLPLLEYCWANNSNSQTNNQIKVFWMVKMLNIDI